MFRPGEHVVATEKICGATCLFTRVGQENYVSSKEHGKRGLGLVYDESNVYWQTILEYNLPWMANNIANMMNAHSVGIFGEIYGRGIRDLTYDADATNGRAGYAIFDVRVEAQAMGWWLEPHELDSVLADLEDPPPLVPRLYEGPYDEQMLFALAEGSETVSGTAAHPRAGLVVRPLHERSYPPTGARVIASFLSASYLARGDAQAAPLP